MKTSALLLDGSGSRIDDWCRYFSTIQDTDHPEDPASASVVHSLLVDGNLEDILDGDSDDIHRTPLADFVQVVSDPLEIEAEEYLYVNKECIYDETTISALACFTRTSEQKPVAFVRILPSELAGLGLMLDQKMLAAFEWGRPIWRQGPLSSASGRGKRGRSGASDLLRNAIQAWTVVSEQTVRHAFTRAKKDGDGFRHRDSDLTEVPKRVVESFLGYYPSGTLTDTPVPEKDVASLALRSFRFETTHSEARDNLFPGQRASFAERRARFYGDCPEIISAQIESDVEHFERLNPGCRFDARAVAEWNLRILWWLRLAYTQARFVDGKRPKFRKDLIAAATPEQREDVARRFAQTAYHGIKAGRRPKRGKATRSAIETRDTVFVSQIDLATTCETALVAFVADIDPRAIRAQHYPSAPEDQEALFTMARWFGKFHRHRQSHLTPHEAGSYLYLLERVVRPTTRDDEPANWETKELGFAVNMIGSFVMPIGLLRLKEAATATISDGARRTVYAVDPNYDGTQPRQAPGGIPALAALSSDQAMTALPFPVLIPAGRLLIPGDYTETWVGRCADLLRAKEEK